MSFNNNINCNNYNTWLNQRDLSDDCFLQPYAERDLDPFNDAEQTPPSAQQFLARHPSQPDDSYNHPYPLLPGPPPPPIAQELHADYPPSSQPLVSLPNPQDSYKPSNAPSYLLPGPPPPPANHPFLPSFRVQPHNPFNDDLSHLFSQTQTSSANHPLLPPFHAQPHNSFDDDLSHLFSQAQTSAANHQFLLSLQAQPLEEDADDTHWSVCGFDPYTMKNLGVFSGIRQKFFMYIAKNSLSTCQKILDQYPTLIHARLKNWDTPLHSAIKKGHGDLSRYLLTKQPNLTAKNAAKKTPIDLALERGYHLCAISDSTIPETKNLNMPYKHWSAFFSSCKSGVPKYRALLETYPALINAQEPVDKNTGLHIAVLYKKWEAAKYLISHGADLTILNNRGETPKNLAEKIDIDLNLLPWPYNFTKYTKKTFLSLCGNKQAAEKLPSLLKTYPSLIHVTNNQGDSGLHIATRKNLDTIVTLLLQHGADKNLKNDKEETPLSIAEKQRFYNIIVYFIK